MLGAADVPSKIVRGEGNKDEANKESVARSKIVLKIDSVTTEENILLISILSV